MTIKPLRLVPDDTSIRFMDLKWLAVILSCSFFLMSMGALFVKGLNFGIDFTGGMLVEVKMNPAPPITDLRAQIEVLDLPSVSIQEFGAVDDFLIRVGLPDGDALALKETETSIRTALDEMEAEIDYRRVEYVGPQVGQELIRAGLLAVLLSLGGILAYVSLRFEWRFGAAAVLALMHDVLAIIGLFAFTGAEFNLATIAAVLTVAGYSINDTVVVFDRVREVSRKYKKESIENIINMALNETLSRTLLTSITTLLALSALYAVGGPVIQGFVVALIFGVVIGTYSTLFVATPALIFLARKQAVLTT